MYSKSLAFLTGRYGGYTIGSSSSWGSVVKSGDGFSILMSNSSTKSIFLSEDSFGSGESSELSRDI